MVDDYVTDDSGTGIVHQAPAFGEDDYRVCLNNDVIQRGKGIICPVDDNGRYTPEVTDFVGRHVKDCDRDIIRMLKKQDKVVMDQQIVHSYPHCWRSDTPLIYKAVPSWFVNVPSIKEKLLKNNLQSYWVPAFVQEKRFANWLADACDWSVSRNRYWGTPLPIWVSEDGEERVVIGSVKELEELSGVTGITDLHRDKIDHITIPSKQGKGVLHRVPEVFDCWFESGSMPYAQLHYPFENKEKFDNGFPADFIAEGLDQTRGWFYTLMVISTALFDKPPFKNLIVNGLVLAGDGKKMSKRLKNYPDPMHVVSKHGADALRLYLINSPVVRAEPLKFQEDGVRDVAKDIFIPWFNVYRFFVGQARRHQTATGRTFKAVADIHKQTTNIMDKWILSSLQSLVKSVREEMKAYRLYTVIPFLLKFIDQLSKWYVRFNKNRLKGDNGVEDCDHALATLFKVLFDVCKLMGPFTPYLTEHMYQNLKNGAPAGEVEDSVHYLMVPEVEEDAIDLDIERRVGNMQTVIDLGRAARDKTAISNRVPVTKIVVTDTNQQTLDDVKSMEEYVKDQLNTRELVLSSKVDEFVNLKALPDRRALGRRLGKQIRVATDFLAKMTHQQVTDLQGTGSVSIAVDGADPIVISSTEVEIVSEFVGDTKKLEAQSKGNTLLVLHKDLDQSCIDEGEAREAMSRVQQLRKKAGLNAEEAVDAWYETSDESLAKMLTNMAEFITAGIRLELRSITALPAGASKIVEEDTNVNGKKMKLVLTKSSAANIAPKKKEAKVAPAPAAAKLDAKRVKACIKEGGKKGQDLAGMSAFGCHFFCTSFDEPNGEMAYLELCMEGANNEVFSSCSLFIVFSRCQHSILMDHRNAATLESHFH